MKSILVGLAVLVLLFLNVPAAQAGEGGGSHYMPGTPGDFAMALIGPPGLYIRNDLIYFKGDIGSLTLGNRVYTSAHQDIWVDTVKLIYLGKNGIGGGRYGLALSVPIVLNAKVEGQLLFPFEGERSGSRSGFGDIAVTGFMNWASGMNHLSTGMTIYMPVGAYDEDRIINLGRNYWSFDPIITYTWLHPKRGHEVSVTTGVMFNTDNDATNYSSGTEWHLDFMVSQHFSPRFAVGLEGSALRGITDDEGPLLDRANALLPLAGLKPLGGFRAEYLGLGPAILYATKIGGTNVNFIVKYLMDVQHENRFNSDYLMISAAFKL